VFYLIGTYEMEVKKSANTWLNSAGIEEAGEVEKYINALYWIITTMTTVGYGDISPQSINERILTMGAMIIAVGNFSLVLNQISKGISHYNHVYSDYQESIHYVMQYMKEKDFPKDMQKSVKHYLEYKLEEKFK
jgi:hypothetical protein